MKEIKIFILMLLLCMLMIFCYFQYAHPNMIYVKSDIDEKYYLVRNVDDKEEASNTLARLRNNILMLSDYLNEHKNDPEYIKNKEYIELLHSKADNIIIVESSQDSIYTSYSVNKGEQIVFCLRTRTLPNNLHDINLMMYVVLHEISHVACPIYDNHGPLFKRIFAFITKAAIKMNIYNKIDFFNKPEDYCGLMISDSIV
jgi:predicted metal-dependent hydrolase